MLYRVQEIQTSRLAPDNVKPAIIAIAKASHITMSEHGYADCGHEDAVVVQLVSGAILYCVGTLETFAEPWEPQHSHQEPRHAV